MRTKQDGPQQHDLSPEVAARMVSSARIRSGERVLDAGSGGGTITRELLAAGAMVTALELDPARVAAMRGAFPEAIGSGHLEVIAADLLRWHPSFRGAWRVVANPPFNLTSALVKRWILDEDAPESLDLVLQRETAEKLTGRDGNHTMSSALASCAGRAAVIAFLRREATSPPSRVDLAVWRFHRDPSVESRDLVQIERLLGVAFAGPRTVTEALRGVASAIQLRRQGQEHGWDPQMHPRVVPPRAWLPLARLLAMCGKL